MKFPQLPEARTGLAPGVIGNEPDPLGSLRAYVQALSVAQLRSLTLAALWQYGDELLPKTPRCGLPRLPRSYE